MDKYIMVIYHRKLIWMFVKLSFVDMQMVYNEYFLTQLLKENLNIN